MFHKGKMANATLMVTHDWWGKTGVQGGGGTGVGCGSADATLHDRQTSHGEEQQRYKV